METTQIEFKGAVTIREVADLHSQIKEAVSAESRLNFDLSETKSVDTAVLQLLLASNSYTQNNEPAADISEISEALVELLRESGAEHLVPADSDEPAEA